MNCNNITKALRLYAPAVVRYGMSLVILWFGTQQIMHPGDWITYVPQSIATITHLSMIAIVKYNGIFETVFGILLLIGWQTRWIALILALHLFDIMYTVGYGEIAVRDFGLAVATFSIFMYGSDALCIHQHKHQTL